MILRSEYRGCVKENISEKAWESALEQTKTTCFYADTNIQSVPCSAPFAPAQVSLQMSSFRQSMKNDFLYYTASRNQDQIHL